MAGVNNPKPKTHKKAKRTAPESALPEARWPHFAAPFALAIFCIILGYMLYDNGAKAGFWYDELWSLDAVSGSLGRMLQLLQDDFHPPGYHALLYLWVELFGNDEIAARALSMIFIIATVPLTYLLGTSLGLDRAGAVLGAGLAGFNNGIFGYGVETRPYAMLIFLTTAALLFLTKSVHNRRAFWLSALLGVMALYTHYAALFILVPAAFVFTWQERDRRILWLALVWVIALLPWTVQILSQARHFSQVGWLKPPTWLSAKKDLEIVLPFRYSTGFAAIFCAAVFFKAIRQGTLTKRIWLVLPLLVIAGTALASYLVIPIFHIRYLLPVLPFAGLAAGFLIQDLRPLPLRWVAATAAPLAVAFFTFSFWETFTVKGEDWRGPAQLALSNRADAAQIITTEESRFFKHYIPDIFVLPDNDPAAIEQWVQKSGPVKVWFLQARQYPKTPATLALATKSEVLSLTNFENARALLLQLNP